MRSNVEFWQELQREGYFEKHPCYRGLTDVHPAAEVDLIKSFLPLSADMDVVVIGCGYGRESAHVAPLVRRLFGIDVSDVILDKAVAYLSQQSVFNFVPVRADCYKETIPDGAVD